MFELELTTIIVGLAIFFVAGLLQGMTGFGLAMVVVPILSLFISPKVVVPILILNGFVLNIMVLWNAWRWVKLKYIWPLMVAGAAGAPLGAYILIALDANVLRLLIGIAAILFAFAFMRGYSRPMKHPKLGMVPVGLFSGMLGSSITIAGPPIILFLTNQGIEKQVFRANIVAYFMVIGLAAVPFLIVGDIITAQTPLYAAVFLPGLTLGAIAGIRMASRVNQRVFNRIALGLVSVAGALSILAGLNMI
jgi:uncharacterized membrane protein YfcA